MIACSTKKNTFISRNSHAISTEYNILYNGGLALTTGVNELKTTYKDNFWEQLPVERMQVTEAQMDPTKEKNPNFERAETKAIKAIQKHSMNIEGGEKNPQMDEAHLMLGQARYYDQRFVPALEAFNYVLYKYPKSDKINEVKVWREKTNMRMENDALAVKNLRALLNDIDFKDQIYADANATLSQAFLNLAQKDSAVSRLRLAADFTKLDEEKSRYLFILGQLYEELGQKDSSYIAFQNVINMNRKSPRQYVMQAHAKQAGQFNYASGDTLAFTEKFNKLLGDRENRPFLDILNHQMALFYDKSKNPDRAIHFYNKSLDVQSADAYLTASNYRNLAEIYFDKARYVDAGHYYDSTMVHLEPRSREFKAIEKKRLNLVDVIKYEGIATRNDSILQVVAMPESGRVRYFEEYIEKLRKEDDIKRELAEKQERANAAKGQSANDMASADPGTAARKAPPTLTPAAGTTPAGNSKPGDFYFYNPTTVAYGKAEFRKNWGERSYSNNWRSAGAGSSNNQQNDGDDTELTEAQIQEKAKLAAAADARYTPQFYLTQLPTDQKVIDSIGKERNFAYYQLGVIYKEKFKEYQLAANKLEQLLKNNPEERLILPSLYNLYKIYEIIDPSKALAMKSQIISQYPDSRYAQILSNSDLSAVATLTPEAAYNTLYKRYETGDYRTVLTIAQDAIDQYTGEEMVSKFELLKAHTIGKLSGLDEYRKALNYVALSYPNNTEGKQAEALLGTDIILMENLQFNEGEPRSWKILYRAAEPEDKNTKALRDKLKKFASERTAEKLTTSLDIYTMDKNFVVIHGIRSEESANGIATILRDYKEYRIADAPIVISSDNYRVVQIKKNLEEYLVDPKKPAVAKAAPVLKKVEQAPEQAPVGTRAVKAKPAQARSSSTPTTTTNPAMPPSIAMPPQGDDEKPEPKKR
jgi:tetratricopeptide (TPR) repeat protein